MRNICKCFFNCLDLQYMKQPQHIAIGIDPAGRKYGFTVSIRYIQERTLEFRQFSKFIEFVNWSQVMNSTAMNSGHSISVGIENSYLVKKYFGVERHMERITLAIQGKYSTLEKGFNLRKEWNEMIHRIGSAGVNRGISRDAAEICNDCFGKESVFEFRPLPNGQMTTGGKRSHTIFEGAIKTYGLTVRGYPKIDRIKRNVITSTKDQDMRDAFFVGELAMQQWKFRQRTRKNSANF